ncbi:MAG: hypothetical protein IKJ63_08250 [Clostridia bacterium]|nr:hypothetical protein [Clostridia bacterium]
MILLFIVFDDTILLQGDIMLKFRKGCTVPFPEMIHEEYEINDNCIIANIDADKIENLLLDFIKMHNEPLFFILEIPTHLKNETEIKPGLLEALHKDVYYIDGCTQEQAVVIVNRIGKLLVNDGLSSFGFGCHVSHDEIMIGKYNVVTINSKNPESYIALLEKFKLKPVDNLVTAWDTFTQETPGLTEKIETDGKDVFDIPELFADWGIYFAEQRES